MATTCRTSRTSASPYARCPGRGSTIRQELARGTSSRDESHPPYVSPTIPAFGMDEVPRQNRSHEPGDLFVQLAEQLRRIAGTMARRGDTLQPTALVNEAYLKLSRRHPGQWSDEHHFLRSAALTMRSILLDHKRARAAAKRGGEVRHTPLDETLAAFEHDWGHDIEAVHVAMTQLEREDAALGEYVNLRFFAGRTNAEACAILGISERTGTRQWKFARNWLHDRLSR